MAERPWLKNVPSDESLRVELVDAAPSTQTYRDLDKIFIGHTARQLGCGPIEALRHLRRTGQQLPSVQAGADRSTLVPSPGKVVRVTRVHTKSQ